MVMTAHRFEAGRPFVPLDRMLAAADAPGRPDAAAQSAGVSMSNSPCAPVLFASADKHDAAGRDQYARVAF
jgi:hypothetical protein